MLLTTFFSITLNFCSLNFFVFSSLESSVESGDAMAEILEKRTNFLNMLFIVV